MRVSVYAVSYDGRWQVKISLDRRVDLMWWDEEIGELSYTMVCLADRIRLGWALRLEKMELPSHGVDDWNAEQWRDAVYRVLEEEMKVGSRINATDELFNSVSMTAIQENVRIARIRSDRTLQQLRQEATILAESLRGRSLFIHEVDALLAEVAPSLVSDWLKVAQLAYLQGQLAFGAGVASAAPPAPRLRWLRRHRKVLRCQRCGSVALGRTACASCGSAACAYCESCLAIGRSRACALLLRGAAHPAVRGTAGGHPTEAMGRWGLSAAQSAAAGLALRFLAPVDNLISRPIRPQRFLLWAVTGAGKTEMIFPLLDYVLQVGGRVLVATPRKDVVLELAPRLAKAFPNESIVTLYGGSEERWRPGNLILATTHQLMRFYQAFDLVIIDEIDAFPFHNDAMLAYAAQHACKPDGKFVYLSATPPRELQKEVASGRLPHAKVPARFHGHPLPVPTRLKMEAVSKCLKHQRIPHQLLRQLKHSIMRGAQCFVFVSRIHHIQPLVMLLRRHLPKINIEGTSSVDQSRTQKVIDFRNREIKLLVTTTILERGVTVPRSDVFILDADSNLFDEASLIQMAGRAGRSKDDPAGRVFLASTAWTRSQKRAITQIKRMNRIAQKSGYLNKTTRQDKPIR
ncbi:DEAD/DEAH box helicase [Paenibacillus sp. CMAA1364]